MQGFLIQRIGKQMDGAAEMDAKEKEAKGKIESLTSFLEACNRAYYVEDSPLISDYEFDMRLKELEALEKHRDLLRQRRGARRVVNVRGFQGLHVA